VYGAFEYINSFMKEGGLMAKLTAKQEAFVNEYLVDLNVTQAAIRAGYSVKTAEQVGYQQLRKLQFQ